MRLVDHVSGCSVSEANWVNELITLDCLSTGLASLAQSVGLLEEPKQQYERENKKRVFFFGFDFNLSPKDEALLTCYFHWFGLSVCNYARLVGLLEGVESGVFPRDATEDPKYFQVIKEHCDEYVNSIAELAPIKIWRNKVFAHFAITDPRQKDNAALLDISVMSPIAYSDGRFRVGGVIHTTGGAEVEMPSWSVTESFGQLAPRFWPGV